MAAADALLLLVLVTDLFIVSSGRLAACVRATAVQGVLLAALPLALWGSGGEANLVHVAVMSAGALAVKAVIIPALLLRSAREAGARREVEPYVSLHLSVLLGALLVMLSLWLARGLVPPERGLAPLLVPAGFATLLLGFLMLVARKYAVTQVVGLPDARQRGVHLRPEPGGRDPGGGGAGHPAGPAGGGVRHGHRHPPHRPRVRPHRHARLDHAAGLSVHLALLVLVPALLGLLALVLRAARLQIAVLLAGAALHVGLTVAAWLHRPPPAGSYLRLDDVGMLFLSVTSLLFAAVAVYAVGYLTAPTHDEPAKLYRFVPYLLLFLSAMTLVTVTQHMAVLWVAVEATTLSSAPLVYFYRRGPALEAAWKYLMICSVGIALALLGTLLPRRRGGGGRRRRRPSP